MKQFFNEPLTYVALYLMVGVFTFGHCWNQVPEIEKGYFGSTEYIIHNGSGTKMIASVGAAAAWPLYWSVKAQEKK